MGQEVRADARAWTNNREKNLSTVYHASIDRRKVAYEPFNQYVSPRIKTFKGYKIFNCSILQSG